MKLIKVGWRIHLTSVTVKIRRTNSQLSAGSTVPRTGFKGRHSFEAMGKESYVRQNLPTQMIEVTALNIEQE